MDFIPARDTSVTSGLDQPQGQAKRISNERQMIAKLDRAELEDRYLRLYDNELVLKRHAQKQEDKIKKMATKLTKLIEEKKKSEAMPFEMKAAAKNAEKDNAFAEYRNKISELQEQNKLLKQRYLLAQQQLQTAQSMKKSTSTYDNVPSKIDTGQAKRMPSPMFHNIRVIGPRESFRNSGQTPRMNGTLLEDARMTNRQLEESLEKAREQLSEYEQQIDQLRHQLQQRDQDFEQNLQRLKSQTAGGDSRQNLQENIDMIRLQRDLRDKSDELRRIQNQTSALDSQNRSLQMTNNELMRQVERLDQQIKDEQQRMLSLRSELRNNSRPSTLVAELNAQVDALRRECDLLREANAKISASAFNADREQEFREKERALRLQIAQLEATMKADLGERGSLLDRLTMEKNTKQKSEEEYRAVHLKYLEMKEKYDDLAEKMKFFERESDINMREIEEALIILRQRKQRQEPNFDFLQKVDDEKAQNLNRRVLELESQLAEMASELEKTRNLLFMQYKINKDYKLEVDCVQKKLDENQSEYTSRIVETGQLLDIRANRIQKLEKALKDVAYGTRPISLKSQPDVDGALDDQLIDEQIELERGQTLIEIHISRASFTDRAMDYFGKGQDPSTFCSIEFFEHELEMTPVVKGRNPDYDFTAQYKVKVDDFLLFYLQREYTLIELHQTVGQSYKTIAACKLSLKNLTEGARGRINGSAKFIACHDDNIDVGTFGIVEYWVHLRVPLEQSFRLLKEKMKAEGYLVTTSAQAAKASEDLEDQRILEENNNQLMIGILNCANVKGAVPGRQPDLYCVYKFYDFPDRDTPIIPSSNNPNFDDRSHYPITMDIELDRYLKQNQMTVFVFDDQDPRTEHYVGRANINLIPLAHDSPIKGTFELFDEEGARNGTIDVILKWTNSYIPPVASTRTPAQRQKSSIKATPREPLALLPDETVSGRRTLADKQREFGIRLKPKDISGSDSEQKLRSEAPKNSAGVPAPSNAGPERKNSVNGYQNSGSRTSSNASVGNKRVSFDGPVQADHISNDRQNDSIQDETHRSASSDYPTDEEPNPAPSGLRYVDESDPDIVYHSTTSSARKHNDDLVTIGVHNLILNENCSVFRDDDCENVFVSFEFLDYPAEDLETPYSLPKGRPGSKYSFNFQQEYPVKGVDRKRQLLDMIRSDAKGTIVFTVVGEPPGDQQDLECKDIGFATVDAREIFDSGMDKIEKDINVYSSDDRDANIGQMNVTVSILDAVNKALDSQGASGKLRN